MIQSVFCLHETVKPVIGPIKMSSKVLFQLSFFERLHQRHWIWTFEFPANIHYLIFVYTLLIFERKTIWWNQRNHLRKLCAYKWYFLYFKMLAGNSNVQIEWLWHSLSKKLSWKRTLIIILKQKEPRPLHLGQSWRSFRSLLIT